MAKAYMEGKGWCIRPRYNGLDEYFSGKPTKKAAEKAARDWMKTIDVAGRPHGDGPARTHLAQAMQDYAMERLPFLKGAVQDAQRINTYLRFAGLQTIEVTPVAKTLQKRDGEQADTVYFEVSLAVPTEERNIPRSLKAHRQTLLTKTARTDSHRRALATKWVSDITRHDLQGLICAMRRDRIAPATIVLQKALLSVLFNHCRKFWRWGSLENPASGLKLPKVNNQRSEVLSVSQQELLDDALSECRNKLAKPTIHLLRESAMRASEPIVNAQWQDVDWERRVLCLPDSKDGGREVPLSQAAISALKSLHAAYGAAGPQPTHNSVDFRGGGPVKLGGEHAKQPIHAGLVCLNSVQTLDLQRQLDLFQIALDELGALDDLVNQAMDVFEQEDGSVEVVTYGIPDAA